MTDEVGYTIEEVSLKTGVNKHTLRFWEREFKEFLVPSRTRGGHRRYSAGMVETVFQIKTLLKERLYSIAGARRALEGQQVRKMENRSLSGLEDQVAEKIVSLVQGKLLGISAREIEGG